MRLIDADALIEKFNEKANMAECLVDERTAERFATFCALSDAVEQMPTVDAVQVIRCKDCKFRHWDDWLEEYYCRRYDDFTHAPFDGFCSSAEEREGKKKNETDR